MKTVYLIRHGETNSNIKKIIGSDTDTLSEKGEQQAERIANRFKDIHIEALISSPFTRARQTADAIAAHKELSVIDSDLFVEIRSPREIEGTPYDGVDTAGIRAKRNEYWGIRGMHVSNEENFHDADDRAKLALAFLENRPEQEIAITSHAAFMRCIAARVLLGELLTPEISTAIYVSLDMSNTGVNVLRFEENKWRLIRWNDTIHLEPGQVVI